MRGPLSQAEFCRKIGVPQTSYSGWELGSKSPSANVLIRISNAIGVSVDFVLGLSDDRRGFVSHEPDPAVAKKLAAAEAEIARLNGVIDGMKMSFEALGKGK